MRRAGDSPRPTPPVRRERDASSRSKASVTASRRAPGTPGPLSDTRSVQARVSASSRTSTRARPSAPRPCSRAFSTRFLTSTRNRASSPCRSDGPSGRSARSTVRAALVADTPGTAASAAAASEAARWPSTTSRTRAARSTSPRLSTSCRADNRSLSSSASTRVCISSRSARSRSLTGPGASSSSATRARAIGERSSWLTASSNSRLASSIAARRMAIASTLAPSKVGPANGGHDEHASRTAVRRRGGRRR